MNEKKEPLRRCIGCGEMKTKKELIRILKTPEGDIVVDDTGRKNGRGAYMCRDIACFEKAVKSKGLERSFKMAISGEVYDRLHEEMMKIES